MPFSEEIKRIVDIKVERLETIPDAFANRMVAIQRAKFSSVVSLLDELEYSNGSIVINEANLLRIENITEQIREVLTEGEFETVVGELLEEFDTQAAINYKYFDEAFDGFEVPRIANEILAQKKREAVIDLLNSTDQYLTNPMRQSLSNAVSGGATRKDLMDVFGLLINGDADTVGRLERATRQIVSDTFALSDRAVTNTVAEQLGLNWYLYVGGLLNTTRPFCKARNGKYFRKEEVQSWASLGDWAGRMAGTTEETIFLTAGGYNCQHSILPVSEAVVPDRFKKASEANIKIDISNKSGFDIDVDNVNATVRRKAKEYGLTGDVRVDIIKGKTNGGSTLGWTKPIDGVISLENGLKIRTNGSMTLSQMEKVVSHEMKHLDQGNSGRFFLKKNQVNRWAVFWEGKEYMSVKEYTKTITDYRNKSLSAARRSKAYNKYRSFPWEIEANKSGNMFN